MAKRSFTIKRELLVVLRALALLALTATSLADGSTYDAAAAPRPRQPAQMFLTEFKLEPLTSIPDAAAIKVAVRDFVNALQLDGHPPYHDDNVTLAV